jgi:hypothetical protein
MSEPMWSSAVIAVLVYGCLPPLGIGVIWSLTVWISGQSDRPIDLDGQFRGKL